MRSVTINFLLLLRQNSKRDNLYSVVTWKHHSKHTFDVLLL